MKQKRFSLWTFRWVAKAEMGLTASSWWRILFCAVGVSLAFVCAASAEEEPLKQEQIPAVQQRSDTHIEMVVEEKWWHKGADQTKVPMGKEDLDAVVRMLGAGADPARLAEAALRHLEESPNPSVQALDLLFVAVERSRGLNVEPLAERVKVALPFAPGISEALRAVTLGRTSAPMARRMAMQSARHLRRSPLVGDPCPFDRPARDLVDSMLKRGGHETQVKGWECKEKDGDLLPNGLILALQTERSRGMKEETGNQVVADIVQSLSGERVAGMPMVTSGDWGKSAQSMHHFSRAVAILRPTLVLFASALADLDGEEGIKVIFRTEPAEQAFDGLVLISVETSPKGKSFRHSVSRQSNEDITVAMRKQLQHIMPLVEGANPNAWGLVLLPPKGIKGGTKSLVGALDAAVNEINDP